MFSLRLFKAAKDSNSLIWIKFSKGYSYIKKMISSSASLYFIPVNSFHLYHHE